MYDNFRQGFGDYLQTQGWDGQGPMFQYAQQLRAQGQHPRADYRQSLGLGGLAGMPAQGWAPGHGPQMGGIIPPHMQHPFAPQNATPPRPMFQPMGQGLQPLQFGGMNLASRFPQFQR